MNTSKIILFAIFTMNFTAFAAGSYRQCVKDKMQASVKTAPCKFKEYYGDELKAENGCAPVLLNELMTNKSIAIGSDEFNEVMDAKKRAAAGDVEDQVSKEGTRCGVSATLKGDTVSVQSGGSR